MLTVEEKLKKLRQLMRQHHVDYYFVPSRDEHNNEYVPACWQRRQWLSDFTGSAGDLMVTLDQAYLWTDSRYFLQAEQQLNPKYFQLMKMLPGLPSLTAWLQQQPSGIKLGVDPKVISIKQAQEWQNILESNQSQLVPLAHNLIDIIWNDQPPLPADVIKLQPEHWAGRSLPQKIEELRLKLKQLSAEAHIIVNLDTLAWLFNIRGQDIEYNPLVIAYAIITQQEILLFVNQQKLTDEVSDYFKQRDVSVFDYGQFEKKLSQMSHSKVTHTNQGILLDPHSASWWIAKMLPQLNTLLMPSPLSLMKSIKTPQECAGMKEAHQEDAVALIKFFCWLENAWLQDINEKEAALKLKEFRLQQKHCVGLSFETISAFAEHGAIIHYQVTSESAKKIDNTNLYLLDSGGQYQNGTTDVTRTLHLGVPSMQQKYHYTLVLKGHLALGHAVFPEGTCGHHLDSLARQFLWQAHLNYGHGTGHGVGCYLCVHEGPQSISPVVNAIPLQPGMIVSNEPGVYFSGEYGIRIENVCQVIQQSEKFFTLTDLTLVPYARNLIEVSLLSSQEIKWINDYHQHIRLQLSSFLSEKENKWLEKATEWL